MNNFLFNFR